MGRISIAVLHLAGPRRNLQCRGQAWLWDRRESGSNVYLILLRPGRFRPFQVAHRSDSARATRAEGTEGRRPDPTRTGLRWPAELLGPPRPRLQRPLPLLPAPPCFTAPAPSPAAEGLASRRRPRPLALGAPPPPPRPSGARPQPAGPRLRPETRRLRFSAPPASRLGLAPSVRGVPARPGHLSRSRFRSHSSPCLRNTVCCASAACPGTLPGGARTTTEGDKGGSSIGRSGGREKPRSRWQRKAAPLTNY